MNTTTVVDILLVEDNPLDAELITRAIRKQIVGKSLLVLEDGAEALDFIFSRGTYAEQKMIPRPRVILLDLKLPKVSGLEVLREIKANEGTRTIPVVIVTSSREDPDIKAAYALGANSYFVKPVSSDAFIEAMKNLGLYWMLLNQTPT